MLAGIFMLRLEAAARAAPKATEVLRCRELTGCAINRLMHCKKKTIQAHRRVGGATAPSDPRPNPFAPCERTDYMPWRPALPHRSNCQ